MPAFPDPELRNALAGDCQRCPALVESRECISWGNGPLDAEIVVVGEAPGAGDPDADRWQGGNWTGMAYTSRHSGRRIRALLADAGYADCYFTNAVKCFPAAEADAPTNREPTAAEREQCRPYLREEIETVAPRVVVPTGKHATKSVFAMAGAELDGFLDAVLEPVDWPALETAIVPLLHPSYQDVWLGRLGYSRDGYVDAVSELLETV